MHKLDYDTNEWVCQNICAAVAIYGDDGACWAYSPNFPELKTYDYEIEDMGGNKTTCSVNEAANAKEVGKGVRNPSEAGIRIGNVKYVFRGYDEITGGSQLTKLGGGGAAIANTNTACIIALVDKEGTQSDGKTQTTAAALEQVTAMAAYLKEQGY